MKIELVKLKSYNKKYVQRSRYTRRYTYVHTYVYTYILYVCRKHFKEKLVKQTMIIGILLKIGIQNMYVCTYVYVKLS